MRFAEGNGHLVSRKSLATGKRKFIGDGFWAKLLPQVTKKVKKNTPER